MTIENTFLKELSNKKDALKDGYHLYAIADGAIYEDLVKDLLGGFFDYTSIFTEKFENVYAHKSPQIISLDLHEEKTQ
jgi:hypothetical protein